MPEEEKFDEEEYRKKNKELIDRIQTLESIASLGGFSKSQELSLSEAQNELAKLEDVAKRELDRVIQDGVDAGEFERCSGGIREKQ
jgi:hypothetical protein